MAQTPAVPPPPLSPPSPSSPSSLPPPPPPRPLLSAPAPGPSVAFYLPGLYLSPFIYPLHSLGYFFTAVFLVGLALVLLVYARRCCLRWCAQRRQGATGNVPPEGLQAAAGRGVVVLVADAAEGRGAVPDASGPPRPRPAGVPEAAIGSLGRLLEFEGRGGKEGPAEGRGEKECTVCMEEYGERDRLRSLYACGHTFHQDCIDAWLKTSSSCPLCRAVLHPAA